jgi:predicted RND superfamily exporter protein
MKNKKGQFGINALAGVAITVVVVAMVSVLGLQLLGDTQDDLTADSAEYNATADAIEGVGKIPEKLPLIVGAVVLVVTITIIIVAFKYMQ